VGYPYEWQIISKLVYNFVVILQNDSSELDLLLRNQEQYFRWARTPYSQDILNNTILRRYRDPAFPDLMKEVYTLRTPEEWATWVHNAEMERGLDLRGWLKKDWELLSKDYQERWSKNEPLTIDPDAPYERGLLRLWLGEEKTRRGSGKLFKA
jgi:hypothetical protein